MKGERLLFDSSVWIEIFSNGRLKSHCETLLQSTSQIVVPTVVQYEVYRKISVSIAEEDALSSIAFLNQYAVTELSTEIALFAADLSLKYDLGMADSLILAHAHSSESTLITLDNDYSEIPGVKVLR